MEAIGQLWCQMHICSASACQERAELPAGLSFATVKQQNSGTDECLYKRTGMDGILCKGHETI